MNFDLTPTQVLCLLSQEENADKSLEQLIKEYGNEPMYNDCKWLQDNGYLDSHIRLVLTMNKQFYFTTRVGMPVFTDKGLQACEYYHSL